jgi:hypothetical protein
MGLSHSAQRTASTVDQCHSAGVLRALEPAQSRDCAGMCLVCSQGAVCAVLAPASGSAGHGSEAS